MREDDKFLLRTGDTQLCPKREKKERVREGFGIWNENNYFLDMEMNAYAGYDERFIDLCVVYVFS